MRTASQLGNFFAGGDSNDVVPTLGGVHFVVLCRVMMAGCILKEPKVFWWMHGINPVLCKKSDEVGFYA